jgi:hypothetical protein
VTLDRPLSFNVTTVFSKLTMSISNWPWLAAEHHGHDRLQLRVSHQGQSQPSFLAPLKGLDAVELVSMRSCSPTTHEHAYAFAALKSAANVNFSSEDL